MNNKHIRLGIDIGSTTAKVVALDENNSILYKSYRRHFTRLVETITEILEELKSEIGDLDTNICMTGSGAMGITEREADYFMRAFDEGGQGGPGGMESLESAYCYFHPKMWCYKDI